MNARILATAAAFAVIAASASAPAFASQCTDACAKAYQQCTNASATDQTCLPKWGQCKKACSPQPAKATAPAPTAVKVASVTPAKTPAKSDHKSDHKPDHKADHRAGAGH